MSVINWTKFTNISFFKHTRCIVSPSGLFIIRSGATNLSNTVLQRCITAYVLAEGGKLAKNVRLTWKHSRNAGNLVQCDILSSAHLKQLFFLSFTHSWTLLYFKAIRPCILYTDVLVDRGVVITVICESSEISCVHRAKTFTQNENPDIIYVCWSKPGWLSLFGGTQNMTFWRMFMLLLSIPQYHTMTMGFQDPKIIIKAPKSIIYITHTVFWSHTITLYDKQTEIQGIFSCIN